ncbi:MAG: GDP-fucose synthetase [Candidatus Riflebacteria bacterium HGW-Riflebacteria-1]|jgi:GDP-L-fucose synthase|nr:MAG: GDP-fucose synthetase [Candidatus Riflebacteria bacterium HGW-Riflebacteria-1]
MNKTSKIYIAGHTGLVGSALVRRLSADGFKNLVYKTFEELDLTRQADVESFFAAEKPEYVFFAAAKVGGIHANNSFPADFIYINLAIQNNIIEAAYRNGVKRLLFLGSSCIYPRDCPQPMKEEHLLTGLLEPTNEPYALAKIAGIKMCESYNRQYGTQFIAVMPTNLYGPNDNFDLNTSHVLPALIRKCHEAKISNQSEAVVWGTGTPRREFLYVDDMAAGCVFLMNLDDTAVKRELLSYPKPCFVNLGTGEDLTIADLSALVAKVTGFTGKLVFDSSKPDGTPRKLLDVTRLHALGWQHATQLETGITNAYAAFLKSPAAA